MSDDTTVDTVDTDVPDSTDSSDAPDTLMSGGQDDNQAASEPTGDAGAPDEYAAFEMPQDVDLDQGLVDSLSPAFKDAGLTQDQAQALVSVYAEAMQAQAQEYQAEIDTILTDKMEEVRADATLGGDNLQQTEQNISNVFNAYGKLVGAEQSQALRDKLSAPVATGLGNDRDLVSFFNWLGGLMGEDSKGVDGLSGTNTPKSHAEILYGVQ